MEEELVHTILTRLRAFSQTMHERARAAAPPGLGMQHVLVMKALVTAGPAVQSELAQRVGLSKGAISQAVTTLTEHGLVERRTDSRDARRQWVHLTDLGQQMKEGLEHRITELFSDLFQDWSDQDGRRLADLLEALVARANASDLTPKHD